MFDRLYNVEVIQATFPAVSPVALPPRRPPDEDGTLHFCFNNVIECVITAVKRE
jgi:hypothetical protein